MISVLLCTIGDETLNLCLDGFMAQTVTNFQLCIVNDGGDRKVEQLLERYPALRITYQYLEPPTSEFRLAAARNLAAQHAVGNRLLCTDDDCVPDRYLIEKHDLMTDDIIIGLRSRVPQTYVAKVKELGITAINSIPLIPDERINLYKERTSELFCFGCNVSFDANMFRNQHGFDERCVGWGYEDLELATRLKFIEHCSVQFNPHCIVYHLDHPRRFRGDNWSILEETRKIVKQPYLR